MSNIVRLNLLLFLLLLPTLEAKALPNGFVSKPASIDTMKIRSGGPPRDGIPAILEPKFEVASKVKWLKDSDKLLQLVQC